MIEVSDLRKSFGAVQAVDGLSFSASDGQVTGLLGPNGAGKTTTLRILYGLMKADSGTVLVDGISVAERTEEAQAHLGVLPDSHGLYPRLSALEHIRYFGELHGLPRRVIAERADKLVRELGMEAIADRRAKGFSHGERMKVALARTLVHDPRNVILDEPTNGLDVMSTRALRTMLRKLRDEGRCVILSSHVMQEVSALCDRIVVLSHGKCAAEGSPDNLRAMTGCEDLEDAFVKLAGVEEPE